MLRQNRLSLSAIHALGLMSIWMNSKRAWANGRSNSRWVAPALGLCWPISADDKNFHGTIICSVVPYLFFAPAGTPPMNHAEKGVKRFHNQTPAQRVSEYLAMPLEEHVAFLKPDDLSLEALLNQLPIPNRPGALVPPTFSALLSNVKIGSVVRECGRNAPNPGAN